MKDIWIFQIFFVILVLLCGHYFQYEFTRLIVILNKKSIIQWMRIFLGMRYKKLYMK